MSGEITASDAPSTAPREALRESFTQSGELSI